MLKVKKFKEDLSLSIIGSKSRQSWDKDRILALINSIYTRMLEDEIGQQLNAGKGEGNAKL